MALNNGKLYRKEVSKSLTLSIYTAVVDVSVLLPNMSLLGAGHVPMKYHPTDQSYVEWDFTRRIRYKGGEMELEVKYEEFGVVGERFGWWNKFINGRLIYGYLEKTQWVPSTHFHFKERDKVTTYECGCSCEEVSYE